MRNAVFVPDLLTDLQWLDRISFRLDRFKRQGTSRNVYVARCPYCGDSDKSASKARLYFYEKKGNLNFDCKNCGEHGSFFKFMKEQCADDFDEYKKDQLMNRLETPSKRFKKPSSTSVPGGGKKTPEKAPQGDLAGVLPITSLDPDHAAVVYLKNRGFGEREMSRLMFSKNFKITAHSLSGTELSPYFPTDPRIVIPFHDDEGGIELIQGRAIDDSSLRYITIKRDDEVDKIFGKRDVNWNKTVYCVEGPLDALFVENCLATCDSNLSRSNAHVMIFDNQPRNKEIVELMSDAIDKGFSVVVWPNSPNKKQDINDMIKLGLTRDELMAVIKSCTYSGMLAKLELNRWKKV